MADTPRGREKNITGRSENIDRKGEGLGTGPVGNQQGYSGRPGTGSGSGSSGNGGVPGGPGNRPQGQNSRPGDRDVNLNIPVTPSSSGTRRRRISPLMIILVIVIGFILLRSCSGGGLFSDTGTSSGSYGTPSGSYSSAPATPAVSSSSGQLETLPTNDNKPGYGYSGGQTGTGSSGSGSGYGYGNGFSYSDLFGSSGYSNSSVSSGWSLSSNTGKLDNSVVSGARRKFTSIKGNGKDVVTVMVYMCGTDLESRSGMASSDLREMAQATIGDNVNIIVFTGGCTRWQTSGISNSVNQIYKVGAGSIRRLEDNMGKDAMTDPDTLSTFIRYCDKNFPANRNMLILWDHGGGSISGYGYDQKYSPNASMNLSGIRQALREGGVDFDFIGFDACLMATVETGLVCADYADYLIASEETEPGYGWYYTNWITGLSRNTSLPTLEIGKMIVDDFVSYSARYASGQKATLSVVDLAELEKTAPDSLKGFASSISGMIADDNYKAVSDARSGAREFATSTKIDQIDLVSFANRIGTDEANTLVEAMLGAVKYNQTSTNMTDAYGLSIYFPYRKLSYVDKASSLYSSLGLDDGYMKACQEFASLETGGQAASGGSTNPLYSLFGDYSSYGSYGSSGTGSGSGYGSSYASGYGYGSGGSSYSGGAASGYSSSQYYSSADLLTGLLSELLSGSYRGISGIEDSAGFLDRGLSLEDTADYIMLNHFDYDALVWTDDGSGNLTMALSGDQWALVHDLELNVFYDDGKGFIDLGLDNSFEISPDGVLSGNYDGTWTAINGRAVAFYHEDTVDDGENWTMTGRVPVLLNGDRAELVLIFDNEHTTGYVAGARRVYNKGETETVSKGLIELKKGDRIEFVCDYYSYDGEYLDSYVFGNGITYDGTLEISYTYLPDTSKANAVYRFTDIYNQTYWTPVMPVTE